MTMRLTELRDGIFSIDLFLADDECRAVIERAERLGFTPATITAAHGASVVPDIRNNARVIFDDGAMAAAHWRRARTHLPPFLAGRQAVGVNERFRVYRYDPGERFSGHVDAPFRRANGEQSLLTLMVYLNEDCDGGETAFGEVLVRPRTGMALIFRHDIFHEGRAVTRGRKYVLRSDVMFNPPGRISEG